MPPLVRLLQFPAVNGFLIAAAASLALMLVAPEATALWLSRDE
jgi:hypothetical protein